MQPGGSNPAGPTPQAYLTMLFFDERFNFISAADGGVVQQQVASSVPGAGLTLNLSTTKAPKNGYVYVYVSNQSNQDVYFDNLNVNITAGNIIEENHYYAYGLRIAGISSKKLGDSFEGTLKNDYLYNDKELFDDGDLNWSDYGFRNYDAQIGRFVQLDPLTDDYPFLTPYQYASGDPIMNVELDGLEGVPSTGGTATSIARDFSYSYNVASNLVLAPMHAVTAATTAVTNAGTNVIRAVASTLVQSAAIGSNLINKNINTIQVGDKILNQSNQNSNLNPDINNSNRIDVYANGMGPMRIGYLRKRTFKRIPYPDFRERTGIRIELEYHNERPGLDDFRWIQTVRTNSSEGELGPHYIFEFNDPLGNPKPEDDSPFFWTEKQNSQYTNFKDFKSFFWDAPNRAIRTNIYFEGELTLVGKYRGRYIPIITIKYGFKVNANGETIIQEIKVTDPSDFQKKSIKKANKGLP